MDPRAVLELAVAAVTLLAGLAGLLGLGARFLLLPWLREHLVDPVSEVKHQVTVNGHSSPSPTVRDDIDTLASEVAELRADHRTQARVFENHMRWAESRGLWARLTDGRGR